MHQQNNGFMTTKAVSFLLNGTTVSCPPDETILQAAERHGVDIPRLCYMEGMRPDGNCRTCMVEIKGERVLAPSCCRFPKDGMEVTTDSPRALDQPEDVARVAAGGYSGESLHAEFRTGFVG